MQHDENYKRLFAFRLMVEHLLRACLPGDRLAAADFSTLRKLSAEYISDELLRRHGDTVWRLRNEAPEVAAGRLPAVLPVVLYNGAEPWTAAREMGELIAPAGRWLAPYQPAQRYYVLDARRVAADDLPRRNLLRAVVGLEQSRSPEDVLRVVEALQGWLRARTAVGLQRAFADWVRQMAERLAPAGAAVPPARTLEDAKMTLVERVGEWPKQWLREGREQGLEEGIEQGRKQGREQGVEQQRALLCRMAAARFGASTAVRLATILAPIVNPARLAEVGDWLVRCDTGGEFLSRVDPPSRS